MHVPAYKNDGDDCGLGYSRVDFHRHNYVTLAALVGLHPFDYGGTRRTGETQCGLRRTVEDTRTHYAQPLYYTGTATGTSALPAASGPSAAPPGALVHAGITYVPAPGQVGRSQATYTLPAGYTSAQPSPAYATYAPPLTSSQQKTGDLNVPSDYYSPSLYSGQAYGAPSGASVYSPPPAYYAPQAVHPTQVAQPAALPSTYHVYGRSQIPPEALYRYYVPHTGHPTPGPQQTQPVAPSPVQPTYPAGTALVGGFGNIFGRQAPSISSALYRSFVDLGYSGASIYGTPMYSKASPGPYLSKYVSPQYYSATGSPTTGPYSYTHNSLRDTRAAAAALGHDGSSSRPYDVGAPIYAAPTYTEAFAASPPARFVSVQASRRGVRYIKKK
ncbi:vegetative cell wall protein gp1-like [Ixodes scapularis]